MATASDPLQIVELKGLIAGPVSLALGFLAGGSLPGLSALSLAGVVGFLGYGVSLALFVMALRHLGTARTGAYFSTAPFIGTIAAVMFLREPATLQLAVAGLLMGFGVWLHLTEDHNHEHIHEPFEHSHPHVPDMHHTHEHVTPPAPSAARAVRAKLCCCSPRSNSSSRSRQLCDHVRLVSVVAPGISLPRRPLWRLIGSATP